MDDSETSDPKCLTFRFLTAFQENLYILVCCYVPSRPKHRPSTRARSVNHGTTGPVASVLVDSVDRKGLTLERLSSVGDVQLEAIAAGPGGQGGAPTKEEEEEEE